MNARPTNKRKLARAPSMREQLPKDPSSSSDPAPLQREDAAAMVVNMHLLLLLFQLARRGQPLRRGSIAMCFNSRCNAFARFFITTKYY
jgi:hypothetical protein